MIKGQLLFDKRIVERNVQSGLITEKEYRNYIDKLKDCSDEIINFESSLTSGGRRVPSRVLEEEDEVF